MGVVFPQNPKPGDIHYHTDDGQNWNGYIYNGHEWKELRDSNVVYWHIPKPHKKEDKYENYERAMGVLDIG